MSSATHAVSKSEIARLGATPSTQAMRNPAIIEQDTGVSQLLRQSDVVLVLGVGAFEFGELVEGLDIVCAVIGLHPFVDSRVGDMRQYRYEVGAELGVAALLCQSLIAQAKLPIQVREFFDSLDLGHIAAESALAEEELAEIVCSVQQAKSPMIIVGESFRWHAFAPLIHKLLAMIGTYCAIDMLCASDVGLRMLAYDKNVDSRAFAPILHALEELPESNGALVYLSLLDERDLAQPVLYATPAFLRLAHLQDKEQVRLLVDSTQVECVAQQVSYLQGATAVLKGWRGAKIYPFIKARFARNGGYNG